MFTVSDSVLHALSESCEEAELGEENVFRLKLSPDGFVLTVEAPADDDLRFEHDSKLVLTADKEAAKALDGVLLDIDESPEGSRLVLLSEEGQ
jgi:hypothetical protein